MSAATAESAVSGPPETGFRAWFGRVRREFRRGRRKLRFTREGKVFVLLTFGIGVGAVNTGNNLLYMLLGSMLAFIVLSGVLAEISLRGLAVRRIVPPRLHAGQETTIRVAVRNRKQHLPSFSLSLRETFGKGRLLDPVELVHLAPAGEEEGSYRCVFPRRGRCRFRHWTVLTTFPFGLFEKSRELEGPGTAIVFPRIDLPIEVPRLVGGDAGDGDARRGPGAEFYALREYRVGDDRRQIAWKQSARRRGLVVREPARGAEGTVEIVILNVAPDTRRDPTFERALDHAGSLAMRLIDRGYEVALAGYESALAPGSGPHHVDQLLTALALIRQVDPERAAELGLQSAVRGPRRRVVIETEATRPWRPEGDLTVVRVVGAADGDADPASGSGVLPLEEGEAERPAQSEAA